MWGSSTLHACLFFIAEQRPSIGCMFIRCHYLQVVRSLITKKHRWTAVTKVDKPQGLNDLRCSAPLLGNWANQRQWTSGSPLCLSVPGGISGNYLIIKWQFIQLEVNDYSSEYIRPVVNPTFFFFDAAVCDCRTYTRWGLCALCETWSQADGEEQGQGRQRKQGRREARMQGLRGPQGPRESQRTWSPSGLGGLSGGPALPLHFLSVTQVKILCLASKTVTLYTQRVKNLLIS